jgi:serine/threonine protein kinase
MEPCCVKSTRRAFSDRSRVIWRAFFYPDGEFMRKDFIPTDVRLEDIILSLEGEDKRLFLVFVRRMLQWLPEDRATAKELMEDPWLQPKRTYAGDKGESSVRLSRGEGVDHVVDILEPEVQSSL